MGKNPPRNPRTRNDSERKLRFRMGSATPTLSSYMANKLSAVSRWLLWFVSL
jgi:hypothetical protein